MSDVLLEAKGVNGQIQLLADRVRIVRKGVLTFFSYGFKGDKEIPLANITAVDFKEAGWVVNGYLRFSYAGGVEARGGILDMTRDENAVMFKRDKRNQFNAMKAAIEQRIMQRPAGGATHAALGISDLEKLAELRDRGIITSEDYEAKKRQILGL